MLLRLWQERKGETLVPLQAKNHAEGSEDYFFCTELEMPEKGCLLWYYFIINTSQGTCYYGNNPEMLGGKGDLYDNVPYSYQITVYNKGAKSPDWFKHSVMYQIFPDRFHRHGNALIPKKGAVYHAHWEDDPCYYKDPDTKEIVAYDFFGGNLKGIEEKLDYLKELGISVIYLNPVFESESNHHYDTGDYHKVDPILGTNEDFKHLIDTAKEKGIRIIIDGVFSHTGSNSRYFNRKGEYDTVGAYQSQDSPYYEWFCFRNWPREYDSWWDFNTLPNVQETNPSYMKFIISGEDSVLHHWMKEGVMGWRLDVIDELPELFSQSFYAELKKTNPEAVMIGEVWEDASHKVAYGVPREYLCGQEMDSAMNYPFRDILFDFLMGRVDGNLAARRFTSLRENYPKENFYAMMNLIGSHDVHRAITFLGEAPYYDGMPAVEQSRAKMDHVHYSLGKARLIMAAAWQMTYPGVPCIYYGDEIGMEGFKDPYNRRPYKWSGGDEEIRAVYKKLIKLRNENQVLQTGEVLPLYAAGNVIAYARVIRGGRDVFGQSAEDGIFIVAFNRNAEWEHIDIDVSDFVSGELEDVLSEGRERYYVVRGRLHLKLQDLKAYKFIDFLQEAGQTVWQILPLGPVGFGYSPYQSPSAFAGNPLLIDLDDLIEKGWISAAEARLPYAGGGSFVDFERVQAFKSKCLKKAYAKFAKEADKDWEYEAFCQREAYWLDDYALFMAIKKDQKGASWIEWPKTLKHRDTQALKVTADKLKEAVGYEKFLQYLFHTQWQKLHEYARNHGVAIMGDMPIFVSHDSADAWANQKLFDLNPDGTAKTVAGVPPDYFSATGQLWGNPQYNWQAMEAENYDWWKKRFRKLYELVDIVRVDHFRGFESYWEVDGKAETAINGRWLKGPCKPFFDEIRKELGHMPIVAEDLGIITDEVEALRDACGFPGMKVLHFTLHFGDMGRFGFVAPENSVVYTGTHDNNTTVGWYNHDVDDAMGAAVAELLHARSDRPREVCEKLIEFAYASDARLAMDERSRMNTPGTVGFNWKWCLKPGYLMEVDVEKLRQLCVRYER